MVKFEEMIFEVSANNGINVYSIDFELNIRPQQLVTTFKNQSLHVSDVFYKNGKMFVLDYKKGLLIFKREGKAFIEESSFALNFDV